jgi:hypothetical protein
MNNRRVAATATLAALALCLAGGERPAQGQDRPPGQIVDVAQQVTIAKAIDTLPKPLKKFYEKHREEMPSLALEPRFPVRGPDRRFALDHLLPFPFVGLPRSEAALKAKFGEKATGIGRLPWLLEAAYRRLVEAFRAGDKTRILEVSDEVGGLVVDLHSPLNLTENYDGQETGQQGLWIRLSEKLPEAMGKDLKLDPDAANYLDDPDEYVFSVMLETYVWVDNLLYLEALASRSKSGHDAFYYDTLVRRVGPILRHLLSRAAEDAGSYWYTAWTVAGRPDLE